MNIANIKYNCASNGEGVRTAVYVSGCRLHCHGCFNHVAWDFNFGQEMTPELIEEILLSIDKEYISGLSILGGEPMDSKNQEGVWYLIDKFRQKFDSNKDIWMWTGYTIGKTPETPYTSLILANVDVIIDGQFDIDLADINLAHRGSSNQRILKKNQGDF